MRGEEQLPRTRHIAVPIGLQAFAVPPLRLGLGTLGDRTLNGGQDLR